MKTNTKNKLSKIKNDRQKIKMKKAEVYKLWNLEVEGNLSFLVPWSPMAAPQN